MVSSSQGHITTAGRIQCSTGLRFGVLSKKEESGQLVKRDQHALKQSGRHIFLITEPLPSDVIASHYEVDHIATNAADNRLCALQWIKGHLSNDNQHGTKTMFERRSSVQQRP